MNTATDPVPRPGPLGRPGSAAHTDRSPEADLVDRLLAGDEVAFVGIVDAWSPGMLRVARGFVSTPASAEEVVQETWVALIRNLNGFEGRSSLRTWAFRILANVARTRAVRESRTLPWSSCSPDDTGPAENADQFLGRDHPVYPRWWTDQAEPGAWPPTPEAGVIAGEIRRMLAAALQDLPNRQRVVVTLRDVEGFDSTEVCDLMGLSAANQRVLLHRARVKLRAALDGYVNHQEGSRRGG